MTDKKPQLHLTRPADRSLEAFKKWMTELAERLVPGTPNDMTEAQWETKHKEFWEKLDKGLAKKDNKKPVHVQFPKDSDAKSILSGIKNIQDEWALKYPDRAHRLYPKIFDINGNRIK